MFSRGSSLMDPSGLVTLRNCRLLLVSISILRGSAASTSFFFFLEYFSILIPEVRGFQAVFASKESSPFLGLDWNKNSHYVWCFIVIYCRCSLVIQQIYFDLSKGHLNRKWNLLCIQIMLSGPFWGFALKISRNWFSVQHILHAIYLHKCHTINLYSWHMQDSYLYAW